jgi:hypothetical protein
MTTTNDNRRAFLALSALSAGVNVAYSSGGGIVASAESGTTARSIGYLETDVPVSGYGTVVLLSPTILATASGSVTAGDLVYTGGSGRVAASAVSGSLLAGVALETTPTAGVIEVARVITGTATA